jgi:hypothetical protein
MLRIVISSLIAIAVTAVAAGATVTFVDDPAAFASLCVGKGLALQSVETFEETDVPADMLVLDLDDPLEPGVPNISGSTGYGFPTGLAAPNLIMQSNLGPNPAAPIPNPRGEGSIAVAGADFLGWWVGTYRVGTSWFVDSLDLILVEPRPYAVGFELGVGGPDSQDSTVQVAVFDAEDQLIAVADVEYLLEDRPVFVGLCSDQPIGRINLYDLNSAPGYGAEMVANVEMWGCASADVNCDGSVGLADLLLVLAAWGPCEGCSEDIDGDGDVGLTDLLIVLTNWV